MRRIRSNYKEVNIIQAPDSFLNMALLQSHVRIHTMSSISTQVMYESLGNPHNVICKYTSLGIGAGYGLLQTAPVV